MFCCEWLVFNSYIYQHFIENLKLPLISPQSLYNFARGFLKAYTREGL